MLLAISFIVNGSFVISDTAFKKTNIKRKVLNDQENNSLKIFTIKGVIMLKLNLHELNALNFFNGQIKRFKGFLPLKE